MLKNHYLKSRLRFAKAFLNHDNHFFREILLSDESKIEFYGHDNATYVWRKDGTAYSQKNTIPTVKHGGGAL